MWESSLYSNRVADDVADVSIDNYTIKRLKFQGGFGRNAKVWGGRAQKRHMRGGPTHRSAPTRRAKLFGVLVGLRIMIACSGRGMPRPYKNERSVTWRSDLFIDLTFTHIYTPTPGPGPQARCGKGVWSPEDQGDRCRVPRSFGPSGAGREQVKLLRRNQLDDHPTKGPRRCGGYTSSVGCADTFPSKGKATGVRYTSSGPSGHLPL